jgi:hypothetical protein
MSSIRTLAALFSLVFITACATVTEPASPPSATADAEEHAAHHPDAAASAPTPAPAPASAPEPDRMQTMQAMHAKMMNAKTPEERQALMADHMKAMQGGMQMMKGMGGKGMPTDMAQRQQMMEGRMDMMQMMMDMMLQRMPASGQAPAPK